MRVRVVDLFYVFDYRVLLGGLLFCYFVFIVMNYGSFFVGLFVFVLLF